jgi:hypothetical protein
MVHYSADCGRCARIKLQVFGSWQDNAVIRRACPANRPHRVLPERSRAAARRDNLHGACPAATFDDRQPSPGVLASSAEESSQGQACRFPAARANFARHPGARRALREVDESARGSSAGDTGAQGAQRRLGSPPHRLRVLRSGRGPRGPDLSVLHQRGCMSKTLLCEFHQALLTMLPVERVEHCRAVPATRAR